MKDLVICRRRIRTQREERMMMDLAVFTNSSPNHVVGQLELKTNLMDFYQANRGIGNGIEGREGLLTSRGRSLGVRKKDNSRFTLVNQCLQRRFDTLVRFDFSSEPIELNGIPHRGSARF